MYVFTLRLWCIMLTKSKGGIELPSAGPLALAHAVYHVCAATTDHLASEIATNSRRDGDAFCRLLPAGTFGFPIPSSAARAATSTDNKPSSVAKPSGCCSCPTGCLRGSLLLQASFRKARSRLFRRPRPTQPSPKNPRPAALTWVHGISARQCRGESTSWTNVPLALPPDAWIVWNYLWVFDHCFLPGGFFRSRPARFLLQSHSASILLNGFRCPSSRARRRPSGLLGRLGKPINQMAASVQVEKVSTRGAACRTVGGLRGFSMPPRLGTPSQLRAAGVRWEVREQLLMLHKERNHESKIQESRRFDAD